MMDFREDTAFMQVPERPRLDRLALDTLTASSGIVLCLIATMVAEVERQHWLAVMFAGGACAWVALLVGARRWDG